MNLQKWALALRSVNEAVLIAGLLLVFGGLVSVLVVNTTNWWNLTLVVLGILLLGAFLAANLAEVKAAGKKRSNLVRANLTLVALAMLGIVGGLNYVVSRHPVRFDLTANKFYSLSDQTLEVLKGLKQDVNVTLFTSPQKNSPEIQRAQALLEEYAKKCGKFKFQVLDGDKNPAEAKRLGVHEYNTVIFESGENRKDVLQRDYVTYMMGQGRNPVPKFQGEGSFTSALLKMGDTTHLVFYFTNGHGEKDFNNPQAEGAQVFKDMLEKDNFTIKPLSLLTAGKVPEDAAVVAVMGLAKPFQSAEAEALRDYLEKGGKLILCVDPLAPTGLDAILRDFGVKLGNDQVVDPTSYAYPDVRALIPQYWSHPIVEKLSLNNITTVMPFNRSVQQAAPALKGVVQTPFLKSTDKGWGETNLKTMKLDASDLKGPVPIAMACEWTPEKDPSKKVRLVVFGDSYFFTNQFLRFPGNLDVAVNSFNWAALEEDKISIRPKEEDQRVLTLSNVSANLIQILSSWVMPLLVLAAGGFLWYRRRSL